MLESHGNPRQLLCWWLVTALTFSLSACSPTSRTSDDQTPDLANSQISYDDYPVVVPKRAALLLDRLMVALEKAVESEAAEKGMTNRIPQDDTWKMDLQRRGQKNGRTYWRCYFNAVTCF
uniref:Allatostatin CC (AST-CC) n=1 Tax=Lygus hesperus TaxID=30085 RepID=A0A7U0Q6H6_LYGHE|nr:allatostatin CC (AST-CC) precursor [Lygus hesperus]